MNEQEIMQALIIAAPVGVIILLAIWRITSTLPPIIDKAREYLAERNRGDKERAEILAQTQLEMVRAAATMADKFAAGMKEYQADSRAFYVAKFEEMHQQIRGLNDRVHDLEEQVEDKDKRIAELERENEGLHSEVDTLRASFVKTQARKPRSRKGKLAA